MVRRGWRTGASAWAAAVVVTLAPTSVEAESASLMPVENLTAQGSVGLVTLSWTDPGNAGGDGFVVCSQPGDVAMSAPSEWCAAGNIERSTSHMEGIVPPSQTRTYSVWPRDTAGTLGPARSITVHGTAISMATVPSSNSTVTGIRLIGRLTDGLTGAGLPDTVVDVYADRPLADPPAVGFTDEYVLVAEFRTDDAGWFIHDFPLRPGWDYQARYAGDVAREGNVSRLVPADGSSYIELTSRDATFVRASTHIVTLRARVPAVRKGDRVVFQRFTHGHWQRVASRDLGSSHTVSFRPRVATRSRPVYRAVLVHTGRRARHSVPLRIRRH